MDFKVRITNVKKEATVHAVLEREVLLERRQYTAEQSNLWDKLSLAQKFATSSLIQFGYDLSFIRSSKTGNIAYLLLIQHIKE